MTPHQLVDQLIDQLIERLDAPIVIGTNTRTTLAATLDSEIDLITREQTATALTDAAEYWSGSGAYADQIAEDLLVRATNLRHIPNYQPQRQP